MGVTTAPTPPKDAAEVILHARGVRKAYQMGDARIEVLKHIDLAVRRGEFLAIEGRSGSGKSTLLHILGALESVDAGTTAFSSSDYTRLDRGSDPVYRILNVTLNVLRYAVPSAILLALALMGVYLWDPLRYQQARIPAPPVIAAIVCVFVLIWPIVYGVRLLMSWFHDLPSAKLRNTAFGFVFQSYHLLPELTVLENTLLPSMVENSWLGYRLERRALTARAVQILDQLGLSHRMKHRPAHLSGGERQRVAIARALMNRPQVLFADEPTGNLDAETGLQIMAVLKKLHTEQGQTILMVTHDRALAREEADRVLLLQNGRLVAP